MAEAQPHPPRIAAIITAGTRPEYLAWLKRQLRMSDWRPQVHERPARSRLDQRQNTLSAMRDLAQGGLFLEDDVDLVHPHVLRAALPELEHPTVLCLVQPANRPHRWNGYIRLGKMPLTVAQMPLKGWGGSQAVYWPPGHALDFLAWAERHTRWDHPSDVMFRSYWQAVGQRVDILGPNPFQHREGPSVISGKVRSKPMVAELAMLEPVW